MRSLMDLFFVLSRREYYADFLITPPLTLALLIYALSRGVDWRFPVLMVAGAGTWTAYEYALHRWVLHGCLWNLQHVLHHRNQRDYIGLHPLATLMSYAVLWAVLGLHATGFTLGFSIGYVVYSTLHTMFHYARIAPGSLLFELKRRHVIHHHSPRFNYGVTNSLWDRAMGTEHDWRTR